MNHLTARANLWLFAVRDGFIALLPLTFFGVLALLLDKLPWPAYQELLSGGANWHGYLAAILSATHGIFSMALAIVVAVELNTALSKQYPSVDDLPGRTVGISALINFMLCTVASDGWVQNRLGHQATLLGLVVGIASTEFLRWAARLRWLRLWDMPYDTNAIFSHAIRLSLPVILSGLTAFAVANAAAALLPVCVHGLAPLALWAQTQAGGVWWLSATATLLNQTLWFVGIHGAHVLSVYASDIYVPVGMPYDGWRAWTPLLNSFVLLGGAGATLGLLLAIALVVKVRSLRRLAYLALVPALFNINEVVLFGLPVVLNPLYLIPFVVVPLLLTLLSVAAVQTGFIQLQLAHLPWMTPPFVSGWLLTGSWRGVLLQLLGLGISTLCYWPFVRRAEAQRVRQQALIFQDATQTILLKSQRPVSFIRRRDHVGMIARDLLTDLRADLARNALSLTYQPKHNRAGQVVGVEALLRWTHAQHGALSPSVAVNLAEDSGDVHALGLWVLDQAFACKARWNQLGFENLTMSINVSPLQLSNPALPQWMATNLQRYALDPATIELEITESAEIPNSELVEQILTQLTQTGVHLSMDDFGMGYSSLLYMRRFHVHTIKIDGSLTRDVLGNRINADIIRTIVALGQAQEVEVVVEFVETREQRDALADMGCDVFQGYFHSPALSEDRCVAYFEQHRGVRG